MIEHLNGSVAFFLLTMSIILNTALLSERVCLDRHGSHLIEVGDRMEFLSTIEVEVF